MLPRHLLIAAIVGLALGCSNEPHTCRLPTDELVMWVTVTDLEGEVEVEVEVEPVDGTTTLELCPEHDSLTVNGIEAEPIWVFGEHYYRVEFASAAELYEVKLDRKDAQSVTVEAKMPPSFEILTPAPDSSHSRADNLDIEWTANWSGNSIQISLLEHIGSSCIDGVGVFEEVEDVGAHQIAGGSLVAGDGELDCEVALMLTRSQVVEHPANTFAGGEVSLHLNRGMVLRSVE